MIRQKVKDTAIQMVNQNGLINLSRSDLCEASGIPDGSFPHVMGCNFIDFIAELKRDGVSGSSTHIVKRVRANPHLRREQILDAAINAAKEIGYQKITRYDVAKKAKISMGLISRYFEGIEGLRSEIMITAIKRKIVEIVAQGLANNDFYAKKAPPKLKAEAITSLVNL